MSITNIISAIGNTKSTVPLLVRDCGIEIPTKVYMTYNQNKDDKDVAMLATRERFVDEYSTSAVWLGTIPVVDKIVNAIMKKKGFNPKVSSKLMKESEAQGLEYNIKKFKDLAPEAVKDLEFLKANKSQFMKFTGARVFGQTVVPAFLMGVVIPKAIFAWTANTKNKMEKRGVSFKKSNKMNVSEKPSFSKNQKAMTFETMDDFISGLGKKNEQENSDNVSFKGNIITKMGEFSDLQKMATTDGGYSIGRVLTARNGYAAMDIGFKMLGMLYLNFLFPDQLSDFLNKSMSKLTNTKLDLDIKMLADKEFVEMIKTNKLDLPKFETEKELIDFLDKNPESNFAKLSKKYLKLKYLKNGIRDPRSYIDFEKMKKFRDNIEQTANKALETKDVVKFMRKAKTIKGANILANVGISSFLLAWGLPKAQFFVRELITKCKLEPGILD